MLRKVDTSREEPIRRWPIWFARLANRLVRWTDAECLACHRPLAGNYRIVIDDIDGMPVKLRLCSLDGECQKEILSSQEFNRAYTNLRPIVVEQAAAQKAKGATEIDLTMA